MGSQIVIPIICCQFERHFHSFTYFTISLPQDLTILTSGNILLITFQGHTWKRWLTILFLHFVKFNITWLSRLLCKFYHHILNGSGKFTTSSIYGKFRFVIRWTTTLHLSSSSVTNELGKCFNFWEVFHSATVISQKNISTNQKFVYWCLTLKRAVYNFPKLPSHAQSLNFVWVKFEARCSVGLWTWFSIFHIHNCISLPSLKVEIVLLIAEDISELP